MKTYMRVVLWGMILMTGTHAKRQKALGEAVSDVWAMGLPTCEECTSPDVIEEPGIGFDLNVGYTTSAIKYGNGTVVDVARTHPSSEYKNMMRRFSPPRVPYGPPFYSPLERIEYNVDQAKRRWRRFRGLPSTEDIQVLSIILKEMRDSTSLALGSPVSKVLPTLPWLPNLLREDFDEAFELAELQTIHTYGYYEIFRQGSTAWAAGMGNRLCEHSRNYYRCAEEENEMGFKTLLVLSFTAEDLSVETLGVWGVDRVMKWEGGHYNDLGFSAWERNEGNKTFWDLVGDKVSGLVKSTEKHWQKVDDLILIGEYGENKRFLDALWKALGSIEGVNVPNLWRPLQTEGFSAELVTARGAAEIARRDQNRVWDCIDPDWCETGSREKSDADLRKI